MLNIPQLIDEAKARKIRNYPCHVNRASQIGHPCLRHLVYCRTNWADKKMHDIGLQRVFDLGMLYEKMFINDLREAGLEIQEQQTAYFDPRYKLSGHIDGKLPLDGHSYPIEAKSMSPYIWQTIDSIEDLRHAKYYYVRGYEDQVLCYLFLKEEDRGLLFLINKVSGEIKQIEIVLDYERMERIIQKCEAINAHIEVGTIPDPISWDEDVCGRCGFLTICYPDRDYGQGIELIDDAELEAMLERREALKESFREYGELNANINGILKERSHLIVGKWEITGHKRTRRGFTAPDTTFWVPKIRKIQ